MTDNTPIDLLCQRMTEDMTARKLGPASQKSRLRAYKRFAAWLSAHLTQRRPTTSVYSSCILPRPVLAPSRAMPP